MPKHAIPSYVISLEIWAHPTRQSPVSVSSGRLKNTGILIHLGDDSGQLSGVRVRCLWRRLRSTRYLNSSGDGADLRNELEHLERCQFSFVWEVKAPRGALTYVPPACHDQTAGITFQLSP